MVTVTRQVGVALGPDKRPVALKRVHSPSAAARLRNEATMLEAAHHPGVVAVVGFDPGGPDGEAALSTAWVPGGNLAGAAERRTLAPLVATLASAATTMADLHDRGIVHGRLSADHVLIDSDGGAVLTGFADARHRGEQPPTDDVASLGQLVSQVAEAARARPGRRFGRRGRRDRGELVDRVAAIGRRAADPLATRRPSARALARQLGELAASDAGEKRTQTWLRTPLARVGAIVAVAALALAAGVALLRGRAAPPASSSPTPDIPAPPPPPRPSPTSSTTVSPSTSGPGVLVAPEPTAAPPPASAPPAAPAGPGPVTVASDGRVIVGERAYEIGVGPDDQVLLGDWDCDGTATLAVVRLPSGAIDVFDRWPETGEPPVTARRLAEIAGATTAEAVSSTDGRCAEISLTIAGGTTTIVTVPSA